jgi:hypothetical protein
MNSGIAYVAEKVPTWRRNDRPVEQRRWH